MSDLPIDNAPFWMARLKLRRARHLINDAAVELQRYRDNPPLRHTIYPDGDEWVAETQIISGPVYASAIIGDVIHNLRAALDLTASELARRNNRSDRNVYFPIADSEEALDKRITDKNFHLAGEDAVKLLKSFEPYRGGNEALRAIHDLDIQDKHTALVPTTHHVATTLSIPYRDGVMLPEEAVVTHDSDSIRLLFPNDHAFAGNDVIPTLAQLVELVDGIVDAFTRLAEIERD